jgi:hypothetical protein
VRNVGGALRVSFEGSEMNRSKNTGLGIAVGAGLGAAAGFIFGQMGFWLAMGIAIGLVVGGVFGRTKCPDCAAAHKLHQAGSKKLAVDA